MNQDRLLLNGFKLLTLGSLAWFGWSGFHDYSQSHSLNFGGVPGGIAATILGSTAANVTASIKPDGVYEGKVDNLPDVAKAVLNFTPADTPNETTSESIRDRIANVCALSDYVGSTDFPGTIKVSSPGAHGWVRVTWKPGACGGVGGALHANPTLIFEISADQEHMRDIADSADSAGNSENAAYDLTH